MMRLDCSGMSCAIFVQQMFSTGALAPRQMGQKGVELLREGGASQLVLHVLFESVCVLHLLARLVLKK